MPWELRKLSTNEVVQGPEPLPENWGPIFGLHGVKDQLSDLSWVGKDDLGWFEVSPDPEPDEPSAEDEARTTRNKLLADSDWAVMSDTPMTAGERDAWIAYRQSLRDITLDADFPSNISWPALPGSE